MGRLLDAFQKNRSRKGAGDSPPPALQTLWPEDSLDDDDEDEGGEAIPFIEVGGPRGASSPAPTLVVAPIEPQPVSRESAPSWMTVRFRPYTSAHSQSVLSRIARELIAFHQPDHSMSAQYRELATSLLAQSAGDSPRVLLFTASSKGVGTTTVLLNTAVTLARENLQRVVVVDAQFKQPAVAERLGLKETEGLREVLAGQLTVAEAVRPSGVPGLSVLTAGSLPPAAPGRLAGEIMKGVLRSLREHHDLILIDGPLWDGRPEVVGLGCACDTVHVCVPESQESTGETLELLQVISEQGASLRGCILTSR